VSGRTTFPTSSRFCCGAELAIQASSSGSWGIRYKEARGHAALTAAILWTTLFLAFVIPGSRFVTGDLKGADFVYFYTLGRIAFDGEYPRAADADYLYARQVELVPASAGDHHLSVYPPMAALFFRPLTAFPYLIAVWLWAILTLVGYGLTVFLVWRRHRPALPDGRFVALAAAAFPPAWNLVLYGQTTVIPLLACTLAWLALGRQRSFAAGAAIGILAVKPQFGLVFAVVLLAGGNWRVIAGVLTSVAAQLLLVLLTMGSQALLRYSQTLQQLRETQQQLEPFPYRMHSLRVLTDQLPGSIGVIAWLALVVVILTASIVVWRSKASLDLRFSTVITATVLVSPHLFVYDAAVMVIPLLLIGAWVESRRPPWRNAFWQGTYTLFVFFLFPTARLIHIQGSVLVMLWMFFQMQRAAKLPRYSEARV
jgi:arabinofuranan 3-O-arabinosyltransferase